MRDGAKSRRGNAWQLHLRVAERQIPHFQVQPLHLAPMSPTCRHCFGEIRGSKQRSFLWTISCL
jgi:hypothetical protein